MSEITIRPSTASELATLDLSAEFTESYPVFNPELQAQLAETLEEDGLTLSVSSFTRIKVPAGGATQWAVPTDGEDEEYRREITGVIIEVQPRRSYWADEDPSGKPPDCRSVDLKLGEGLYGVGSELHPTGDCATCPMNARGSGGKEGSEASACREQRLLFFATAEEMLPVMVSVPPGSLKSLRTYQTNLIKRGGRRITDVETSIKLAKETSSTGIEYAMIKFANTGKVFTPDERRVIRAYGDMIKDLIKVEADLVDAAANDAASYSTAPVDVPFDPDGLPLDEVPTAAPTGAGSTSAAGK